MRNHEQHVSDEELLLAAEGEPGRRANCVRTHLESCTRCRARAAEMENVLTEVSREEKNSLDAELPSIAGPRAMLRTRLAQFSTGKEHVSADNRIHSGFPARAFGAAALAAVLVGACILVFRHFTTPGPAPSLSSSDGGVLPNRALTPGLARQASLEEVCLLPHEEVIKEVSPEERERVFAEYGISSAQSDQYEVDYLITPGLGGADDIRNLWPEPYNVAQWNARVKDVLEERLHQMVCSHQLDLSAAQEAIATNWIAAYEKYVQPATSHTQTDETESLAAIARSVIAIARSMVLTKEVGALAFR
jgi:hypothetical protein